MEESLAGSEALLKAVSELARRNSVYICIGIAVRREGSIFNAAVTFDREGRQIDLQPKPTFGTLTIAGSRRVQVTLHSIQSSVELGR